MEEGNMARIKAPHDFNGDNISDVLWRNVKTGEVGLWLVKNQSAESVSLGPVTLDWTIVTTGDLDGDLTSDIIWQDRTSGQVSAWFIKDAKLQGAAGNIHNPGTQWLPIATAYFGTND